MITDGKIETSQKIIDLMKTLTFSFDLADKLIKKEGKRSWTGNNTFIIFSPFNSIKLRVSVMGNYVSDKNTLFSGLNKENQCWCFMPIENRKNTICKLLQVNIN